MEHADEYDEDFEDQDIHVRARQAVVVDDDLPEPDTTMLDSVVLPAIASVRPPFFSMFHRPPIRIVG